MLADFMSVSFLGLRTDRQPTSAAVIGGRRDDRDSPNGKAGVRSICETGSAMKAIVVIIGWTLPPALVREEMSNDRAFLSIIEEAGESLEMLGILSSSDDDMGTSLWLYSSVHLGLMGKSAPS
jgi:hypothetical protein